MAQSGNDRFRSTLTGGHDFMFDFCCDLCERDGLQKEAVGFCADCQDYLCSECFNTHLRPKPMRHHVLLDQHQMPKEKQQQKGGNFFTETCTIHPHKTVEYFCAEHDELGCSVCITLNHRICKGVDHISGIANDILSSVEYDEFQKKVTSLTQVTTAAIQTTQDQVKRSKTYHTNAIETFKPFKKDLIDAVERTEKNLMQEADTIKGDDDKKMNSLEDKYKGVLKNIQALTSKITSLQNDGMFCQMFIALKRAKREIDDIESRVGCPEHNIKARHYKLIASSEVQLLLDSPMVKMWVVVENKSASNARETPTFDEQSRQPDMKKNQAVASLKQKASAFSYNRGKSPDSRHKIPATPGPAAMHHGRENKRMRANHIMDTQVSSRNNSNTPWITGCVILPGDKLVVVDNSNQKLQLIDLTHNQFESQMKMSYVWDVTTVSSGQVAVTHLYTQKISVVNISANKLSLDRELQIKGQCWGIASMDDKLVVSYDNPVMVEILNLNGKVLHTVITEKAGRQLFTSLRYVAVSRDQTTIYIADWDRHTVTSVDLTGQVQATYKDDNLTRSSGLAVDSAGRVYVCGWSSSNILQLTADLKEIQEILQKSDGVVGPSSVCFCDATDRLYIGVHNEVKVYQLE